MSILVREERWVEEIVLVLEEGSVAEEDEKFEKRESHLYDTAGGEHYPAFTENQMSELLM
jgi:hypothetical protein